MNYLRLKSIKSRLCLFAQSLLYHTRNMKKVSFRKRFTVVFLLFAIPVTILYTLTKSKFVCVEFLLKSQVENVVSGLAGWRRWTRDGVCFCLLRLHSTHALFSSATNINLVRRPVTFVPSSAHKVKYLDSNACLLLLGSPHFWRNGKINTSLLR